MKFSVESHINIPQNLAKVEDESFWLKAAQEYYRLLLHPYIPFVTGTTANTVEINSGKSYGEIEFVQPNAHYLWNGELMVDPNTGSSWAKKDVKKVYTGIPLNLKGNSENKHPKATDHWEKAAEPTQLPKLIAAMQDYIDTGGLNLND